MDELDCRVLNPSSGDMLPTVMCWSDTSSRYDLTKRQWFT